MVSFLCRGNVENRTQETGKRFSNEHVIARIV